MKKWICLIVVAVLAELITETRAGSQIKVVDGDSLEIGARRIRLLGIDAPELFQECFDTEGVLYACGRQAKDYLQSMIDEGLSQGEKVKCKTYDVDRYHRDLSICHVGKRNLNFDMVKAGYAISYKSEMFSAPEKKAKSAHKGIWQGKFMRPELFRTLKREQEKQKKSKNR